MILRTTQLELAGSAGPDMHDVTAQVAAAVPGPSVSIPVAEGKPLLGTWRQVVVDLDNRPRRRRALIQVLGE